MKKRFSVAIILTFLICMSIQTYAKDVSAYSSGNLSDCEIDVSVTSDGIAVTYMTGATQRATEIGCKDIVLQEKVNGSWRDINIPDGKTTNSTTYAHSSLYKAAVKGRAYRAHCTHYANFSGTVKTIYNECDSIIFN